MQKILIDTLPLESGHAVRGMGFYVKNLVDNLKKQNSKFNLDFSPDTSNLKPNSYNLVHFPYFDLFRITLPLNKIAKKQIVTIPDLIPLIYPQYYPLGIKSKVILEINKFLLKKNVDAVITISETSKKDIVRLFNFDPEKIFVTYLAPNFKFEKLSKPKTKYKLPKRFVLYVGDVNWNKDLLTLVKACIKAKRHLVIVGKQAASKDYDKNHIENKPLKILQEKYGNNKYIHRLGFVSNEDLNAVWNLATVYCQPSLYEGFGLPVIEAMQAEVPVIASKTQAIVEVAGEAAEYFETSNVNNLVNKINNIIDSKKTREELIERSKQHVKKYNWQKTASETLQVYEKLL